MNDNNNNNNKEGNKIKKKMLMVIQLIELNNLLINIWLFILT